VASVITPSSASATAAHPLLVGKEPLYTPDRRSSKERQVLESVCMCELCACMRVIARIPPVTTCKHACMHTHTHARDMYCCTPRVILLL
jgi:hypothetical protein